VVRGRDIDRVKAATQEVINLGRNLGGNPEEE
jgi:hypothetical protein